MSWMKSIAANTTCFQSITWSSLHPSLYAAKFWRDNTAKTWAFPANYPQNTNNVFVTVACAKHKVMKLWIIMHFISLCTRCIQCTHYTHTTAQLIDFLSLLCCLFHSYWLDKLKLARKHIVLCKWWTAFFFNNLYFTNEYFCIENSFEFWEHHRNNEGENYELTLTNSHD